MPIVDFSGIRVEVPDTLLKDPAALGKIAEQVRFTHNLDTTTGADAATRAGLAGLEKPADQTNFLRSKGFEAAQTPDGPAFINPKTGRPTLVDEQGLSARDLIDLAPMGGELLGSTLGAIGGFGVGNVPGAVVGSGLGAVAGREAVQGALRTFTGATDTRSLGEHAQDAAYTGAVGALGEGAGQVVGAGVRAVSSRLRPSVAALADQEVADAIRLPFTGGMLGSRVGAAAERSAGGSLLGRGTLEATAAAQDKALLQAVRPKAPFVPGTQDDLLRVADDLGREERLIDRIPDAADLEHQFGQGGMADHLRAGGADSLMAKLHLAQDAPLEVRQNLARSHLVELGGGQEAFNAGRFLKSWERLDPRDKHLLGDVSYGGLRGELNALVPLVQRTAAMQARAKAPRTTPLGSLLQVLGVGGGYVAGGPVGAATAALAPAAAAKLMTSPRFVRWLTKVPASDGALARHLTRLGAIAEGEGLKDEIGGLLEAVGR
ncbi:MAG: hypothetical protein IPM89_14480 [Candidatus Competibacteraceae bacterium]|nr:MAG: hypothetical protein IPM89_14480 [Candidatus Competibacteraceae bacterium]